MVYYFCHCMSLDVCPGIFYYYYLFILERSLANLWERNCPFWLSVYSVLNVVLLLYVCFSFPLVSSDGRR